MNVQHILNRSKKELKSANINTPDIDAKAILTYVLEQDDIYLLTHNTDLITNAQYQKFRRLIRRRKVGEPVAYLIGHKEFYGLDFAVNKHVLIPRPETEILVEEALTYCSNLESENFSLRSKNRTILDVGSGSGCIIISILKNLSPESCCLKAFATDISSKALNIAKKNAKNLGVYDNIQFLKSDLLSNPRLPKKFDLIIANLPYLTEDKAGLKYQDSGNIGLNFEPKEALYASDNGFALIEQLIKSLPDRLTANGIALLETDESHAERVKKLTKKLGFECNDVKNVSNYSGFFKIMR